VLGLHRRVFPAELPPAPVTSGLMLEKAELTLGASAIDLGASMVGRATQGKGL
jgi:hypothetical protein